MIVEENHRVEDSYTIELNGRKYLYTMRYWRGHRGSDNDIIVLNEQGDRLDLTAHMELMTRLTEIVYQHNGGGEVRFP